MIKYDKLAVLNLCRLQCWTCIELKPVRRVRSKCHKLPHSSEEASSNDMVSFQPEKVPTSRSPWHYVWIIGIASVNRPNQLLCCYALGQELSYSLLFIHLPNTEIQFVAFQQRPYLPYLPCPAKYGAPWCSPCSICLGTLAVPRINICCWRIGNLIGV